MLAQFLRSRLMLTQFECAIYTLILSSDSDSLLIENRYGLLLTFTILSHLIRMLPSPGAVGRPSVAHLQPRRRTWRAAAGTRHGGVHDGSKRDDCGGDRASNEARARGSQSGARHRRRSQCVILSRLSAVTRNNQ